MSIAAFTSNQWIIIILCAVLIGMAKAGLSGAGLLIVPLMAEAFGGRPSTGLVLPMLIMADIFAVLYYHRHTEWKYLKTILPWAVIGIIVATITGDSINEQTFNTILAFVIFLGIALVILFDVLGSKVNIPQKRWFTSSTGLAGGFTTMIGNAAGPIMNMYLLSVRLPKSVFIGTAAWFFLLVNVAKVPLHIVFWKTIDTNTLIVDLMMLPAILAGVIAGIRLVKLIPEKWYRVFIIASTILASFVLFMRN